MAGTLTISTLSDGTNSTSSTNCIQGSAKAWLKYDLSAQAVRASYNVSSVTYISTGNFTVNFTNAFADTNYTIVGSSSQNASGQPMATIGQNLDSPSISTTSVKLYCLTSNSASLVNNPNVSVSFFR